MREVWLGANRRAILFGLLVPAVLLLLAAGCGTAAWFGNLAPWAGRVLAGFSGISGVAGILILISLLIMYRMPRLAYEDDHLLVYLGTAQPYRVPVDKVEVFFLGQAPSGMPKTIWEEAGEPSESSTVVVRIAESAEQWQKQEVRPIFGHWCDGYIIVRGTWSERITGDVVMGLNRRLMDRHRDLRERRQAAASGAEDTPGRPVRRDTTS